MALHVHRGSQKLELLVITVLIHGLLRGDAASDSLSGESCICPGATITYRCTVLDGGSSFTTWSGTAVDAAITEYGCPPTVFDLGHNRFGDPGGVSITCGGGALVARSVGVVMSSPDNCYTSEFTVPAFPEVNNTVIDCSLSSGFREVGSSSLIIAAQQSTPDSVSVTFSDDIRQFSLRWNSGPDISCDPTEQYAVDISGPDDFCNPSGRLEFVDASTMEYQCSNWPQSSLGQTYTFQVAAVNCGSNQTGLFSSSVGVRLQVPTAPTLTVRPVYAESTGELIRIESNSTTVPTVTIADGVNGSADAYIFSYNDVPLPPVPSGQCTGGTCRNVFTPTGPAVSQYTVSVTARNVVGEGPSATRVISATNDLVEVEVDVDTSIVQCRFLGGFTGTAQCQIEYSTQEDLSGSFEDTGSSTSGDTVTVTLTTSLEERTTYYYRVTATAEGVSVRVEGRTGCAVSELANVVVDSAMNGNCMEGFARIQIPAVRICFNGTVPGSIAIYLCECEEQYVLPGVGQDRQIIRTCQDNNTWSGIIPVVERVTYTAGLILGIIGALLYVINMITILVMAIVTFRVYTRLTAWLFAVVVVVWLILPPVGLALGLWLVRKQVEFVKKWCTITVLIMIVGNFLWFTNLGIWIAIAALFGPSGDCRSVGILIGGVVVGVITALYWIIIGPILHRNSSSDETDGPGSGKGKKSQDIPMESGGEYGKLQHGGTLTPPHTDPSADPMYAHLAAGKAEEGSAEEYSQLQRQKPPKAVANISDANYSHFEGDAPPVPPPPSSRPSRLPSQGQHKRQPPTVPPHTVADPDPPLPEVYSEVNQGPRYKTKQTSLTGL